ncbi:MAG: hypothetical protein ACK5NB_08715 [Flavobacteriaceae bacterium]
MDKLLRGISFIFHPLLMPIIGTLFYFWKSPRYFPSQMVYAKLVSLSILTLILPILICFLLKTLGKIKSGNLETTTERILPLGIYCIVVFIIIERVVTPSQIPALYYFFLGILISNLICLVLALFKFKASIHMIAVSGLFMFFVVLGFHFGINLNNTLAFTSIVIGTVATSRLHVKAHTFREIIVGFFVGLLPQVLLAYYWV